VAQLLGYADWKLYTSHAYRRTAITFGAEAGLTMPQLKTLSGHKSDSALEGYIERSMPMKLVAAGATSILGASKPKLAGSKRAHEHEMTQDADLPFWMKHQEGIKPYPMGSAPLDPKNDKRRCAQQVSAPRAPVYNITLNITGDVSAPLSLFSDGNMPL
jgi:hypothetical protein